MTAALHPHRGSAGTFDSLKIRNFRLFFVGQGISQIGEWLKMLAQSLLVLKITDSGIMVGLLAAAQFGPIMLFGAASGLVSDRVDKRKLLVSVQAVMMAQSFALALVATMDSPSIPLLFVLATIGGFCTTLENPARRSIVVELVDERHVSNAVSMNSALMTGARVIGPAIAGALIGTVGYAWCFALDGLSYLAVMSALTMMNPAEIRTSPAAPKGKGQVRAGLRYVRSEPTLLIPLVMTFIIGLLTMNFAVVFPLFVTDTLGGTETEFTLFFSVLSIGSFFAALVMARRKTVPMEHVVWAAVAFGAAMLVLTVAPNLAIAFPLGLFVGIGSITFMTSSTAIVQLHAEPSMRGRVLALQAMVFMGTTPIGGPIVGALCEWFGARAGVAVGGFAALGAALYGYRASRTAKLG